MSDAKQRPGATPGQKPQNQTDESKGPVKNRQRTDDNTQAPDTPRGSEPETRSSSYNRN